eukprot:COSAG02_NODE_2861_length_7881_cov_10.967618_7_plen_69_part_00
MCRVPRLSDQRLRFFALTVEFYAYDDQLPSPPVGLGGARALSCWHALVWGDWDPVLMLLLAAEVTTSR